MQAASRPRTIAAWVVAILLCIAFLGAGIAKLTSQPMMVAEFTLFGYPLWFMSITGAIEIISAVLVVIPRFSRLGAALLVCVMLGAIFSHVTHGQAAMIGGPVVLLILALAELWLRGGFTAPLIPAKA